MRLLPKAGAARLSFERLELARVLTPLDAKPQEAQLFADDLKAVLDSLHPRAEQVEQWVAPLKIEKIA